MGLFDRLVTRFVGPTPTTDAPSDPSPSPSLGPVVSAPAHDVSPTMVDDPNRLQAIQPEWGYGGTSMLYNMASGAGSRRDSSIFAQWVNQRRLSWRELFALGRNQLSARGVALVGNTATREGWRIVVDDKRVEDPQALSVKVAQYEERLGISGKVARAAFGGRLYGNAIVLLNIIDGRPWDQPVDVNNIVTVRWAAVIDARDFMVLRLGGVNSRDFAEPEIYRITDINGVLADGLRYGDQLASLYSVATTDFKQANGSSSVLDVHASRVLAFPTRDYYPMLEGMQDSLSAYFEATNGMQKYAREASLKIYKIKDLLKKVLGKDALKTYERVGLIEKLKSSLNAWVVDAENEEIVPMSNAGSGVEKVADPFMVWVATGFNIPITQFWGVSPGGFGTGDSEIATWHAEVRAFQDQVLAARSCLPKLQGYLIAAQDGGNLSVDIRRTLEFADLSPPSEETRADLITKSVASLTQALSANAITRAEYRTALERLGTANADIFPFVPTEEGSVDISNALVGHVSAILQVAVAAAAGEVPVDSAQALAEGLVPLNVTPEVGAKIFDPIRAKFATTATAASTTTEPEVEDATLLADPELADQLASVLSKQAAPADARTAQEVAQIVGNGVTPEQIHRRAHKGELNVYSAPGPGFGRFRPRYSVAEVQRALLRHHGVEAPTATGVADWSPLSCCVVLRLPTELALWVPYKAKDPSPPHVTLLYFAELTDAQHATLVVAIAALMRDFVRGPVELPGTVDYFDSAPDYDVAYATVDGDIVHELHHALHELAEVLGLPVQLRPEYIPHATLAYVDKGARYMGPVPKGAWEVDAIEVWRGDDRQTIGIPADDTREVIFASSTSPLLTDVRDLAEPTLETIYQWLREHYCMAPKLTRPRIEALLALRAKYSFLRPPRTEHVYRGLSNIKPSLVGKLLAETDPVRDKSWTTSFEQACAFAAGKYIKPEDVDPEAIGVVLIAEADPNRLVLNASEIADIPEIGKHFNPLWDMTIEQSIRDEAEVLAHGPLVVQQVRAVLMASGSSPLTIDEAESLVQRQLVSVDEDATEKRIAEAFKRYHATVNMGAAELREWSKTPWAKKASLSRGPIDRNLTLLETPREQWTLAHARSAMRTVSFVSRMKGAEQGKPVKVDGREGPSKRDISLKNWAFDPNK